MTFLTSSHIVNELKIADFNMCQPNLFPEEERGGKENQFHIATQFPQSEALLQKNLCCAINLLQKNCVVIAINMSIQEPLLHKPHCMRTPPYDQMKNYLENLIFSEEKKHCIVYIVYMQRGAN